MHPTELVTMDSLPSMLSVKPTQDIQRGLSGLCVPMPEKYGKMAMIARRTLHGPSRDWDLASWG